MGCRSRKSASSSTRSSNHGLRVKRRFACLSGREEAVSKYIIVLNRVVSSLRTACTGYKTHTSTSVREMAINRSGDDGMGGRTKPCHHRNNTDARGKACQPRRFRRSTIYGQTGTTKQWRLNKSGQESAETWSSGGQELAE